MHKEFMLLSAMPNMLVTAYLTFVGGASFFYINSCQLSYFEFALHQGLVVASFSAMSFYADKIVKKIGGKNAVRWGMIGCGVAMCLFVLFAFSLPFEPVWITMAMCLFAIGAAFPMSVTFSESLEVVPTLKGVCSSFIMSSRLLLSSLALALTGLWFDGSMQPIAIVNGIAVLLAIVIFVQLQRIETKERVTI
jgi:MFS transporter, DHA1 family, multidrug resistance protein